MSHAPPPRNRRTITRPGLLALGLAPIAGFADTLLRGLLFGLVTLVVTCGSIAVLAAAERRLPPVSRVPVALLVMAAGITAAEAACRAFAFDAWLAGGALLPLLVANGALLGSVVPDGRQPAAGLARHLAAGLADGAALLAVLAVVGAVREIAAPGMAGMLNPGASGVAGFGLAPAPAGAFLLLALLVAGANARQPRRPASGASVP